VPAPSGGRRVRVENLRDQPVEIHHGEAVVVIAPYETAELPVVATGGEQLAQLARQELVSIEPLQPAQRAATPARRRAESKPNRPRSSASTSKRKPPKRGS
jgi:hypothetical protein